jgi:two-component system cell cycle sensor histidine kinase/response regulator CckA
MKERGGIITISLLIVKNVSAHCVACAEALQGDFIELNVTDNGTGIEPKVITRIFDPFFTTKEQGEGTGLGLSTVSGMVHSSGGHILINSKLTPPHQGTAFRLLFPIPPEV